MKLILKAEKDVWHANETVIVRLIAINNNYKPTPVDRRLLVGPNPVPERSTEVPFPISVEPAFPEEEQNRIILNPWCFYGRQRSFDGLPSGRVIFYAYLLKKPVDVLLPKGPENPEALLISAEPLVLIIKEIGSFVN